MAKTGQKWVVIDVENKRSLPGKYNTEEKARAVIRKLWLASMPADVASRIKTDNVVPPEFEGDMGDDEDIGFYNWLVTPSFCVTWCREGTIGVRGLVSDRVYVVVPFPDGSGDEGYYGKGDAEVFRTAGQDGVVLATELTDEEHEQYFPEEE